VGLRRFASLLNEKIIAEKKGNSSFKIVLNELIKNF
jgi:hypothetical protein